MASYYNDLAQIDGGNAPFMETDYGNRGASTNMQQPPAPQNSTNVNAGAGSAQPFSPVGTVTNQAGEVVPVDRFGRDANGALVIQGSAQPTSGGGGSNKFTAPDGSIWPTQAALDEYLASKKQSKFVATDGTIFGDQASLDKYQATLNTQASVNSANQEKRQSAYDLLKEEFTKYGLQDLVTPLQGLIQQNVSPSEFSLRLKQTPAYQQRFSANADRVKAGLTELTPAEYVGLEDQYQKVMQNYGLPASYYTVGQYGKQAGFDKLLAGDVSATELEDRIATAQNRVVNANPDVMKALKSFYPDITNGDILAYTLDPKNALNAIHRKVTAAEIGGAALGAGLETNVDRATQLAAYGITGQQYAQNAQTISQASQRGSQLASIYGQTPYGQTQAEQEALNLAGGTQAAAARKNLTQLEQANFSGQSGTASNVFSRERAMSPMMLGVPGAGSF
jgi:hypothetical protein